MSFNFPELKRGVMLKKDGTSTKLPGLPDLKVTGNAWIVESTDTRLRIFEQTRAWDKVPTTYDQLLELQPNGEVNFSVKATVYGVPMPALKKRYLLTEAGMGWIKLASLKSGEPEGFIAAHGGTFRIDLPGPLGTHDRKELPLIKPGQTGYEAMPRLVKA